MADPPASPISQLLHTLGITREDLEKRSNQMRQFLTTADANAIRVAESSSSQKPSSSDHRLISKSALRAASSTRSRSRASSYSIRGDTPPMTPIKTEPMESAPPLRHFDSMEMVIERQRRQSRRDKKERRERERESLLRVSVPQPPSPSPNNASQAAFNLDSFMQGRDAQRVTLTETQETSARTSSQAENPSAPPVTPQRSKYYRDHTNLSANAQSEPRKESQVVKAESPTPTRSRASFALQYPSPQAQPQYYPYPQYLAYARLLPPLPFANAQAGPSALPVTPQTQRTYAFQRTSVNSPLPPSSPPPASSPVSTPHRRVVNMVSSPGPMGPLPDEEEYDNLPYTLPPGPYSPNKPDLSYAALVGQAILSSPDRRLTLQEIYDWITIVYPHFKRGEQTWMNSIRHVLSTTMCFRKVPRERSVGRTQWAIWDEDLECFKGGGFRKQLCRDIMNGAAVKEKVAGSKGKGKGRKRADTDDGSDARKAKRPKKDQPAPLPSLALTSSYLPATMSSHPLFPPTRPTSHHQPYYESCLQQPLPGDIIFPPLPASVGYSRIPVTTAITSTPASILEVNVPSDMNDVSPPPPSSSSSSVPDLTPNCSSSSPPLASSEIVEDISATIEAKATEASAPSNDEEGDDVLENSFLVPVKYWGQSPSRDALRPSFKLAFDTTLSSDENDEEAPLLKTLKNGGSAERRRLNKRMSFPPIPVSPTMNRKASSKPKASKMSVGKKPNDTDRPTTPTPSTPPRNTRQLPTSSIRTPLSSKGINPAALYSEGDDDDQETGDIDLHRTPRKRVSSSGLAGPAPVTPRRLVFPSNQNDSPYRTPVGVFGTSPFRTPGSRAVFDPHDPGALLDEELSRMGAAGHGDSPAGLFGKGRGSLLYDSPGLSTSPGQLHRWW